MNGTGIFLCNFSGMIKNVLPSLRQRAGPQRICSRQKSIRSGTARGSFSQTPHMRGKGGLAGGRTVEHGITPAYAGKASGAMSGSDMDRITPAYAGKSCKASQAHLRRWDHPRVCGEKAGLLVDAP